MSVIQIKKSGVKKAKRVGRGIGSGRGGYSGRGAKGQKARSGGSTRPRFEGGQMPLYRRLPKRGFKNNNKITFNIINVEALNVLKEGTDATIDLLKEMGLVKDNKSPVKLLADGELKVKNLKISVNKCSESARKKVEEMNGQVSLI
jgi:large subunit ribosomal protein L15